MAPSEVLVLLRPVVTILSVLVLSFGLAQLRDAQGDRVGTATEQRISWVRTVDGWEPSSVLTISPPPPGPPAVHPALVAILLIGLSLFALLALPPAVQSTRKY